MYVKLVQCWRASIGPIFHCQRHHRIHLAYGSPWETKELRPQDEEPVLYELHCSG